MAKYKDQSKRWVGPMPLRHHSLYETWSSMRKRCNNPKTKCYAHYGGRGITVCPEWSKFWNFVADIEGEIGPRPSQSHSIDRILTDGNYEPGNVRWATHQEQMRNKRSNRLLSFEGKTQCVADWADEYGISRPALRNRVLKAGWTMEAALTTPVRHPKAEPNRFV